MKKHSLAIVLLVLAAGASAQQSFADEGPQNLGFESGSVGEVPQGWRPSKGSHSGYTFKLTDQSPKSGKLCVVIEFPGPRSGASNGNLMQSVDATPYRGKQVRFRAAVRTDGVGSRAHMWMRVDRPDKVVGFFDNMMDRPIVSAAWSYYEIVGDVEDDAESLFFGVLSMSTGSVWMDDVSLEMIGVTQELPPEPARPLSGRALDNLVAFTKLYGYVRFFHPSDEAAAMDARAWDMFAISGLARVEPAANAEELAASLIGAFRSVAPTLEVWAGGPENGPPASARSEDAKGAVCWRHSGLGGLNVVVQNTYRSARVAAVPESADARLPAPGTCLVKDLGGGVCCRVCVAVDVDADGKTLPRPATEPAPPVPERPAGWKPSGKDRSTRLAGVVIAWNIFQHFFPYFDVSKPDWPAVLRRSLAAAATDADDAAFVLTLRRLHAELKDGHGSIIATKVPSPLPPDMALDWADDGKGGEALVVVAVGSATDMVKVGDEIVAVAGTPTAQWYAEARPLISTATEQWARHYIAAYPEFLARGKGGTCEFTIRRDGQEQVVQVPRFKPGGGALPPKERHPANGAEVGPSGSGIVYFDLNRANAEALAAAMPKLQAAKAIIFDARGYPGSAGMALMSHLTDKPLESARWIVPIVTLPDQDPEGLSRDERGRWNLPPMQPRLGGGGQKIAFLTGGGAISAAESIMGIVEHYKLGEIVGGPTAGTNGNINPFTLPGGFTLWWTGMKVLKHDGSRHHGVGIQPTVPARRTVAGIAAGRDEVLDAAVVALALLRPGASSAGDDPAPAAAPPAAPAPVRATPEDVAQCLAGWAEAMGADVDATTGYPKKIRRTKDSMVMVLIPAGTFQMGAVPGDSEAGVDEKPRHAVTLTKAYYLDEHEVTNEQFERFVAATTHKTTAEVEGKGMVVDETGSWSAVAGASWKAPLPGGTRQGDWARHPVALVSWDDAKAFSDWASVSLPTEAQFERALRGGAEGKKYPWGDELPPPAKAGNFADATAMKKFTSWKSTIAGYDDEYERTAPAKSFAPDAYGLYDLWGNVWEWCADAYDFRYYASSPERDPSGRSAPASARVLRGGFWYGGTGDRSAGYFLRSSRRSGSDAAYHDALIGFRCARSLP